MNFYQSNITNIGDPFVLKINGKIYLYATSFIDGFYVFYGDDLQHLDHKEICYQKGPRSFGYCDFWAPEVVYHDGKYIMHYTAREKGTDILKIGVAIAPSPTGPFIDVYDQRPMFDLGKAVIDGHVFDDDGKYFFYFALDCSTNVVDGCHISQIYVAELKSNLLCFNSTPKLLLTPTLPYEKIGKEFNTKFYWNEGPCVIKRNKLYYLMYSANFFASKDYCICVATSKYPDHGFEKYAAPVLKSVPDLFVGCGHNSVLIDNDIVYCVYHVSTDMNNPTADRTMCYSEISFDYNHMVIKI